MGEVISISRVSDLDIFSEFDSQCPSIPHEIDVLVRQSAEKAVDKRNHSEKPASFRAACVAVVVLSLIALAGVKFVASQVPGNYSSGRYADATANMSKNWRESRESWQAYITHLQNDPLMVHLQAELKLFQQQYPE